MNLGASNKSTSNRRSMNINNNTDNLSNNVDAIKVLARFRPSRNKSNNDVFKLNVCTSEIEYISEWQETKLFKFDKLFDTQTTQIDVFDEVSSTVTSVIDGFNGTIMAYGQTSAGKSWTMEGSSIWDPTLGGIVPRCVDKLFDEIEKAEPELQFQIIVSYYEIYCEKVRDLLNPQQINLKVRETKCNGFIVQDVTEIYCTNKESVMNVMELGKSNRIAAPTLMNAESSRSHSIFSILVQQHDLKSGRHKKGMLFLVDLAGSEKVSKTGAKGLRLEEAKNINSSLSSLGMVINALSDGAPHVPYRDSKLTMLLMEALGGNSKTTLIICCNSEKDHISETLSTLRFGERAKRVKNVARINEEFSAEELKIMLESAKKDINYLKKTLQKVSISLKDDPTLICSNCNLPVSYNSATPLIDMINKALGSSVSSSSTTTENDEMNYLSEDFKINNKNSFDSNQTQKLLDEIMEYTSKIASLEEEIEAGNNRFQKEYELRVEYSGEVEVLKTAITELEEKLLKTNLQAKKYVSNELLHSNVIVDDHIVVNRNKQDMDNQLNNSKSQSIEEQLYTREIDSSPNEIHMNELKMIAEVLDNNNIESNSLRSTETTNFSIHDYEKHVRRLEFILDQEQHERFKVEGKLIGVMEELSELQCDNSGSKLSTPQRTGKKSLFNTIFSTTKSVKESSSNFTSQLSETFFKRSYNSRESVLAETLELAQQRIVQLVMEIDSNNEAQSIVLETKESVLRSLARQNTHLAIERDNLTKKNEELSTKVEQLTQLLRSIQHSRTIGSNIRGSISGGYNHRKSIDPSNMVGIVNTNYSNFNPETAVVANNSSNINEADSKITSSFININEPDTVSSITLAPQLQPVKPFFFNGSGKINRSSNSSSQLNYNPSSDQSTLKK